MSVEKSSGDAGTREPGWTERNSAWSVVLASIIVALAGLYVGYVFNQNQLEIARINNQKQLELTQFREMSGLLPKLVSENINERRYTALALGLYGKVAIRPLITLLNDDDANVRESASKSLSAIGGDAVEPLVNTFRDNHNSDQVRAQSLETLDEMRAQIVLVLSRSVFEARSTSGLRTRETAARIIGNMKDKASVQLLLNYLKAPHDFTLEEEKRVARAVLHALGGIGDTQAIEDIFTFVMKVPDEELRKSAEEALVGSSGNIVYNRDIVTAKIRTIMEADSSDTVSKAASEVFDLQQQRYE